MICQGAGKDSTEIFNVIHPDYVIDMANDNFCIGKITGIPQ